MLIFFIATKYLVPEKQLVQYLWDLCDVGLGLGRLTPNKLFRSASRKRKGIFDTWRRFGPTEFGVVVVPCWAEDCSASKSVCCKKETWRWISMACLWLSSEWGQRMHAKPWNKIQKSIVLSFTVTFYGKLQEKFLRQKCSFVCKINTRNSQ